MHENYLKQNCITANQDNMEKTRLLTTSNAEDAYQVYDFDTLHNTAFAGVPVGNYIDADGSRKIIGTTPSHTLVIGGTGAGKTEGYFLPAIEMYAKSQANVSMFITDIKGSSCAKTQRLLRDNGYKIYVLDFKEPFRSLRYNPLSYIFDLYQNAHAFQSQLNWPKLSNTTVFDLKGKKFCDEIEYYSEIHKHAQYYFSQCQTQIDSLSKLLVPLESHHDLTWDYGSRDIVFATLWGMLEDSCTMGSKMTRDKFTLANLIYITQFTKDDCAHLIQWIHNRAESSYTSRLLSYYEIAADRTRDSYINNTANKLNRFANIPIETITSASDLDITEIVEALDTRKVAIYCITDETSSVSHCICSMFISQMLAALQRHRDKQPFGTASPFVFLLDEFANIPVLPNMPQWLSNARSRNIWFHLGLQSFGQLNSRYSDKEAEAIMDNCDTQIFLGCNNYATVAKFSASLGQTCKTLSSYSVDNHGGVSVNFLPHPLPVVRQCDLAALPPQHAYVKCFRKPVLYTQLNHFYTYHQEEPVMPVYRRKTAPYDATKNRYDITGLLTSRIHSASCSLPEKEGLRYYSMDHGSWTVPDPLYLGAYLLSDLHIRLALNKFLLQTPSEKHSAIKKLQAAIFKIMENPRTIVLGGMNDRSGVPDAMAILYVGKIKETVYPAKEIKSGPRNIYCEIITCLDNKVACKKILHSLNTLAQNMHPDALYVSLPKNNSADMQQVVIDNKFEKITPENAHGDRVAFKR